MDLAPPQLWTAADASGADRYTMDVLGAPSPVLMERAALCVSAEVEALAASSAVRVEVLCGPGNNGGDGLAVARQLWARGYTGVRAVLATARRNDAAEAQLALARAYGVPIVDARAFESGPLGSGSPMILVDALLGTGSRGAPRGGVAEALAWATSVRAAQPVQVVAVDVPTGVDVDSGAVSSDAALAAACTVTFQRSKPGLHLTPGRALAGRVVVADIGLRARPGLRAAGELVDPRAVASWLGGLGSAAHKGQRGHVGVLAGAAATPGAALLVSVAALRMGAGLVTLSARGGKGPLLAPLVAARPELMLAFEGPEEAPTPGAGVLVVGPGRTDLLTGAGEGAELAQRRAELTELDRSDPRPMVWDASGLEFMAWLFGEARSAGPRVITPHPGEAARCLAMVEPDAGWTSARVQADRRAAARALAERSGATVVLKGAGTVIAEAEAGTGARWAVCPRGSERLATAGSGDVLAGAIAALLARGLSPWQAAAAGVHVHAVA
ncbi:hypothetical protein PPSIR1_10155, partial [Plesiocystis pacifica SIR-1]